MKFRKTFTAICLMLALALMAGSAFASDPKPVKYVFFFIGDGLGLPQRTAAEEFTGNPLVINTFEAQGITTTHANDRFIIGSAAAATALASGVMTNINYIGMDPEFKPVKTIAEMARDKGMKVGIVSSVSIDHATPAAFYAHVKTRKMYHEIDHALAASGFDYFAGGGLKDPAGKKSKAPMGDAMEAIKKAGYKVVTDKAAFQALKPGGKVLAYNAWLQDGKALPYQMDTRPEDIDIAEFTAKGIEMLDNDDQGFFLMVEAGKIDWACHANDAAASIHDTLVFDKAVSHAVEFAKAHPEETLIVVTGDHECGGLTLGFAGTKYQTHFEILSRQTVSFQKFTDEILPEFKKNHTTDDFKMMEGVITKYFGLKFEGEAKGDALVLKPFEVEKLKVAFNATMTGADASGYGSYDPLAVQITHLLNNKAGLGWTSFKHTGVPVSTSASGVGAELFNGMYHNTAVALKLMKLMGMDDKVHYVEAELKVAAND